MKKTILIFVLFLSAVLYSQSYQPYMTVLGFPDAWNITEGHENVIIAVLGNGIHINHPALINSISIIPGWNFYANNSNITETRSGDQYSHETSAAGIIAAQHSIYNNYVVKGLAPNCKIMPVKFYEPDDENDPMLSLKLSNSLNYVRDKQLQYPNKRFLINLSYSFTDFNQTEKDLVISAIQNCYNIGIPVFCSGGNNTGQPVEFPAQLSTTFAITCVMGIDYNYVYNNIYPTGTNLDLAAPEHILYTTYSNNSYYNFGQTSGAAPQACAAAALFLSIEPTFSVEELRRVLHRNTVTDILDGTTGNPITYNEDGYNNKVGYGRINVLNSLGKHSIVFLNNVEGNSSIGQMTVEDQTLSSGDNLLFFTGEEVNATAYEGTYSYNNLENKFYNWNFWDPEYLTGRERVNYFFSDQLFDVGLENTTAFFKKTAPLTVRNSFEGVVNGGTILFGESTLPGDVINRNSPYLENVFINDPPQVVATYRAEANQSQNLFNTTWNFFKWESGSTNRIREAQITQTNPIEWRANFKGQFRSNDQNGISSGSQRKLVRTDNGIYHCVYESMGEIWYTHSLTTNFNGAWSQDYSINEGQGQARNPSIDFEGNKIKIVMELFDPNYWSEAVIFLMSWEPDVNGNYNLSDLEDVQYYSPSYFGNAKPVIAYNDITIFIAYRKNSNDGLYQRTKWYSAGSWVWNGEETIPNTTLYSNNPSITGIGTTIYLAWQHSLGVRYIYGYAQGQSWRYTNYAIISTGSGYTNNYSPSISLAKNNYPVVS